MDSSCTYMQTQRTLPYFLLALVVIVAWGFSNIATKYLYAHGMGPYAVLAIRTLMAYGILILLCHDKLFANSLADEARLALLGILCVPIYHGLENIALTEAHAGTVSVVMASAPLLTALLVILRWRAFRLHWMTKLGICTAVTGLCLVAFDDLIMSDLPTEGFILALIAAFAWAVYTALLKSVHSYSPLFVARKAFGWGLFAVMPFFLAEDPTDIQLLSDPSVFMTLVFLAAGPTTLCTVLWQRASQATGADAIRNGLFLIPIITIIAGWWFLDEGMSFVGIMGTLMVLCGVWSADIGMKRVSAVLAGADPKLLSAKISF